MRGMTGACVSRDRCKLCATLVQRADCGSNVHLAHGETIERFVCAPDLGCGER